MFLHEQKAISVYNLWYRHFVAEEREERCPKMNMKIIKTLGIVWVVLVTWAIFGFMWGSMGLEIVRGRSWIGNTWPIRIGGAGVLGLAVIPCIISPLFAARFLREVWTGSEPSE